MFFLSEGIVHVLSVDNRSITAILTTGSYFGEFAIFEKCKRMCSVLAASFCCLLVLRKKDFNKILKEFPDLVEVIK